MNKCVINFFGIFLITILIINYPSKLKKSMNNSKFMGNLRLYKLYLIFNPRISTLPVTAPGTIFWRQTSYGVIRID